MSTPMSLAQRWIRPAAYAPFVELVMVAGTLLGPPQRPYARALDALAVGLIVIAGATVATARAWPSASLGVGIAATVAYYALGYHTDSPYFVGFMVTAYLSAGANARYRAIAFAALTVAAFGAAALWGRSIDRYGALATSLIILGGFAAGQVVAEVRAAFARRDLDARDDETRRLVAEERLRIARELHDVVSHSIAMINVQASTALHVIDSRPEQSREALNNIKAASHDALRDMRHILGVLRDSGHDEARLPVAGMERLPALIENVGRSGTEVALTIEGEGRGLPAAIDVAAYRIVQEALTNAVRHAPGAAARVKVERTAAQVAVTIENDAAQRPVAIESRHGTGHGLAGMRERVRSAGGTLEAGPTARGGFVVHAVLPVDAGV